ncbi:MAG TPA: hypothetical protein VF331_28240 [Polyangiales bacterium]
MEHFDVYVAGFEVDEERATRGLMQAFGLGESAARSFVRGVPRVAKRRQTREAADRYVDSLRAIGGQVECRPSRGSDQPPAPERASVAALASLPAPGSPDAATARGSGPTPADDFGGAVMPVIPKAARLPSEAADHPLPAWVQPDVEYDNRMLTSLTPTASVPGVEDAHGEGQVDQSSTRPAPAVLWPADSSRPAPAARHAGAGDDILGVRLSGPPGVPVRGAIPALPRTSFGRSPRTLAALGCLLLGGAYLGSRQHWFQSAPTQREAAWRQAGIEVGRYEDAARFIEQPGAHAAALPNAELARVLDALRRTGAPHVWAIDIVSRDGKPSASALLIELPHDAVQRETIFWQHVKPLTGQVVEDTGQSFLRVEFAGSE